MKKRISMVLILLLLLSSCSGATEKKDLTKEELFFEIKKAEEKVDSAKIKGDMEIEINIPLQGKKTAQGEVEILYQKAPLVTHGKLKLKTEDALPMVNSSAFETEFFAKDEGFWTKDILTGKWTKEQQEYHPISSFSEVSIFGFSKDEKNSVDMLNKAEMRREGDDYLLLYQNEGIKEKFGEMTKGVTEISGMDLPVIDLIHIQVESLVDGKSFLVKEHRFEFELNLKSIINLAMGMKGKISYEMINELPTIATPEGINN